MKSDLGLVGPDIAEMEAADRYIRENEELRRQLASREKGLAMLEQEAMRARIDKAEHGARLDRAMAIGFALGAAVVWVIWQVVG